MKMKLYHLVTFILFAGIALAACSPEDDTVEKTIFVGPTAVDCEGEGPQECLLVKENPDDEYSLFYDQIEGFDYQEGFEYELQIKEETIENPPAGGTSLKWILVELVNKTGVAVSNLESTPWVLHSYSNGQGEMVNILPGIEITAEFQEGQIVGNAGCNSYFGAYEIEGDDLTVGFIGATEMFCSAPEYIMEQESEYLAALQDAATHQIVADQLWITNTDNETVLVFSVAEPTPLTETTWLFQFYGDGQGSLVSVIAGTEITAIFGEDGSLTGSAGCNNYTTTYEVEGERITTGPVAATVMMCPEVEGIMEQESSYLAVLKSVTAYAIKGNKLELISIDDGTILSFTNKQDAVVPAPAGPIDNAFPEEALKNLEYRSDWTESGTAPLTDGEYRQEMDPDSAIETVVFLTDHIVSGRLSDGQEAAVVILVTMHGGSGTFYDLSVVVNQDGEPVNIATIFLGDRVEIKSLSIETGEIVLDMVTQGPEDPFCCPTQRVVQTYALQGDQLVQTSSSVTSAFAAEGSEIIGVLWKWEEYQEMNDDLTIVEDVDKYTLKFLPEGQLQVQADCNSASGTYMVDGSQLFIEITTTTMAECPPESHSDEYIRLLNDTVSYVLEGDHLFISIIIDSGIMKFARGSP